MRAPATAVRSQNAKLGAVMATYAAQGSCPTDCVFFNGGGCYAETGRLGKFVTAPLNAAGKDSTRLEIALAEAAAIDRLDASLGLPLRLHVVGDCADDESAEIVSAAAMRYTARGGGKAFGYTHAWRTVARISWGGVSILASCETAADVLHATARGYATALVVQEFESDRRYHPREPLGPEIIPCPAQTRHGNCADCGLCFNDKRLRDDGLSIGFEVHGIPFAQRAARTALRNPDDPERRISSEERIRIIRDRYLAAEGREPTIREVAEMIDLNPSSVAEWLKYLRGEIDHPAERRRRARRKEAV